MSPDRLLIEVIIRHQVAEHLVGILDMPGKVQKARVIR